jgi:ribosomal protein L1
MSFDTSKSIEAFKALQKFLGNQKKVDDVKPLPLEEKDQFVFVNISTKKFVSDKKSLKPKRVEIPYSLFGDEQPSICLFSKDPQRTYKDVFQSEQAETRGLITRVVGVSKLKGKFKQYEARRQLYSGYDVFLADDNVVTTLPRLLGKVFYGSSTKIPLTINLKGHDKTLSSSATKERIDQLLKSTWFTVPSGTLLSVKVGRASFEPEEVAANIDAVMDYITSTVLKKTGWDGILSVNIKTEQSPSLPIYLAEKIYNEEDIADDEELREENTKRKREDNKERKISKLDEALAEVVGEEEIEEYKRSKRRRGHVDDVDVSETTNGGEKNDVAEIGEEPAKNETSEKVTKKEMAVKKANADKKEKVDKKIEVDKKEKVAKNEKLEKGRKEKAKDKRARSKN